MKVWRLIAMFKRKWPMGGLVRGFFRHDDRPIRYVPRFQYRARKP